MKKFLLLSMGLIGLTNLFASNVWAIEGGSESAPNSKPYMVSLESSSSPITHRCNGILITPTTVLTTAVCVTGESYSRPTLNVLLGAHNRFASEPSQVRINAQGIMVHEEYNPTTLANNIALVFLSSPAPIGTNIGLVPLPAWNAVVPKGGTVTIVGWGSTQKTNVVASQVLREGLMKVEDISLCQPEYPGSSVGNANICATAINANMCNLDGAGSMIYDGTLVGFDSLGSKNACLTSKEVFVKVAPYVDWLDLNKK